MKNHESYLLRRLRDLLSMKSWVDGFVDWFNSEHRHSGIKYVAPNQQRLAEAEGNCDIRQQSYDEAHKKHRQRWSRLPRDWSQPEIVRMSQPHPPISAAA